MPDGGGGKRSCRIPLDARLTDRDKVPRAGAPALPVPLWARLDALVEQANEAGAATTRVELIAAWLSSSGTPSAEVMREWIDAYRTISVRDLTGDDPGGRTRSFDLRQAGRPRRP